MRHSWLRFPYRKLDINYDWFVSMKPKYNTERPSCVPNGWINVFMASYYKMACNIYEWKNVDKIFLTHFLTVPLPIWCPRLFCLFSPKRQQKHLI